jgi:hypothetical protein
MKPKNIAEAAIHFGSFGEFNGMWPKNSLKTAHGWFIGRIWVIVWFRAWFWARFWV